MYFVRKDLVSCIKTSQGKMLSYNPSIANAEWMNGILRQHLWSLPTFNPPIAAPLLFSSLRHSALVTIADAANPPSPPCLRFKVHGCVCIIVIVCNGAMIPSPYSNRPPPRGRSDLTYRPTGTLLKITP